MAQTILDNNYNLNIWVLKHNREVQVLGDSLESAA